MGAHELPDVMKVKQTSQGYGDDALEMFRYCEYPYRFLRSYNVILWIIIPVYVYSAYNEKKEG